MRTRVIRQIAVATLLLHGFTSGFSRCHAASYIWNVGSGDWSVADNWSPNGVPGVDDTATISFGTVTVSTDTSVRNLNLYGGALGGTAVLTVVSDFTWSGGAMVGSVTTRLLHGGTGIVNNTVYFYDNAQWENGGNTTWSGGGIVVKGGTATFRNLASGVFDITGDTRGFYTDCTENILIQNEGLLRRNGNGDVALARRASGCGGSTRVNNAAGGSIVVQSGSLTLDASGATAQHSGNFTVEAGATLGFYGEGSGVQNILNTVNIAGVLAVYGSSVNLEHDLFAPVISVSGGSLTVQQQGVVGDASVAGGLNINGAGTVTNLNLSGTLGGSGVLTVLSNFNWTGGEMRGSGTTRLEAGGTGTCSGTVTVWDTPNWENAGHTTWSGGDIRVKTGTATFRNLTTGVFDITGDGPRSFHTDCTEDILIQNEGLLRRNGSGSVTLALRASGCGGSTRVNNAGLIVVQSGALVLNASGGATAQHSGNFTVEAGATLGFSGEGFGVQNITQPVNLAGNFDVYGSSVNVANNLFAPAISVLGGTLTLGGEAVSGNASVSGTLIVNGVGTVTNLDLNGNVGGTGLLMIVSNFNWSGGDMVSNVTTRLLAGGNGILNGTVRFFDTPHWENGGHMTWSAGDIRVKTGTATFRNLTTGVFDITGNGPRSFHTDCSEDILIYNEGLLRRNGNGGVTLALLAPDGCHGNMSVNNSGTLEAQSGALVFGGPYTQTAGVTYLNGGIIVGSTLLIQGGTLSGTSTIIGNVISSGTVSPGASPGVLTIQGDYRQTASGTLNIEINGMVAGTDFDRLAVTGTATLAGTNHVVVASGFAAPSGTKLKFLTAGVRSGTFSRFNYEFDYGQLLISYPLNPANGVDVELIIPPIAINPPNASVPHNGNQTFTASGGIPPYVFSFVVNNSCGNIDGSGLYTAGSIARVSDTVKVTDLLGANATATVSVLPDHYRVLGRVADASAAAIETATVTILSPISLTASTDAGGFYSFEQVPRGANITVSVSKAGYTFSPDQSFLVDNDKAADFTGTVLLRSISCIVTNSGGLGVKDVRISLLRNSTMVASPSTDANGQVTVNNLPAVGTYQVVPSKLNATFSPTTRFVSLLQGNAIASFRITESFIISGQITDSLGNKVADASVRYQNTASTRPSSAAKTGVNGNYKSRALAPGTYVVRPSKPGWVFNPPSRIVPIVNADVPGQDFTTSKAFISISGSITNLFGASFDHVTVSLTGGTSLTTTTTGDGSYVFQVPGIGTYNITPSKAGLIFQPPSVAITPSGLNVTQSFRAVAVAPLQHTRIVALGSVSRRLVMMNGDGSDLVQLPLTDPDVSQPDFSRDGLKLAYSPWFSGRGLFVFNADGSGPEQLLDDEVYSPAWSPDASRLSFAVRDGDQYLLKVMNVAGGQPPVAVRVLGPYFLGRFSWSPDGTQLIGSDYTNVVRVPVSGTGATKITTASGSSALSPDGSKVAFVDSDGFNFQIFIVNTDGTGRQQLTYFAGACGGPTWSPDSSMIAFNHINPNGGSPAKLYTMMADGSLQTAIATAHSPTWGPEPTVATPVGNDVRVTNGAATVTFSTVNSAGTTTVVPTPPATLGNLPPGYVSISGGGMNYEVSTTAGNSGPIQICFTVSGINDAAIFDSLRVFHGENGVLVDRTIRSPNSPTPDFSTRTICALVPSLSPFTIAMEIDTNLPIVTGVVIDEAGNPIPDVTLELGPTNPLQTTTSIAGQFAFANLKAGSNYTIIPLDDRYDFTPPLAVLDEVSGTNLIAFIAVPKPDPNRIFDIAVEGGDLNFSFVTQIGKSHTVQYNDSLTSPNWLSLTNVIGDGLVWRVNDPLLPTYTQRYYRLSTQ